MLKVVALASYPDEAASTRFRLTQYRELLTARDIKLDFRYFLSRSAFRDLYDRRHLFRTAARVVTATLRSFLLDAPALANADVVFVQRQAMLAGPPLLEWIGARLLRRPMILDLDDATYLPVSSPTYGRIAAVLRWQSKTNQLIRWSRVVICGNDNVAEYARSLGARAVVLPTIVDTAVFRPDEKREGNSTPVIGWVGSHSTFRYVEQIFPALQRLSKSFDFTLRLIGSGVDAVDLPGVRVETRAWTLEHDVDSFQQFDVGIYPMVDDEWAAGKSGLKAVQYLSTGIPYVVTPVGAAASRGSAGVTHFEARSIDEWHDALATLLRSESLRSEMGRAGREHALKHYSLSAQADTLVQLLSSGAYRR